MYNCITAQLTVEFLVSETNRFCSHFKVLNFLLKNVVFNFSLQYFKAVVFFSAKTNRNILLKSTYFI